MSGFMFRKRLERPRPPVVLKWADRPVAMWLPIICLWLGTGAPLPAPAAMCENIIVLSDFASDTDGWSAFVDKTGDARAVRHVPGFTPLDSRIQISETEEDGGLMYFAAPSKFLGNQSAALGGQFRFRFHQNRTVEIVPGPDVVLESGGVRIIHNYGVVPGPVWTTYEVPLEASAWKHSNGAPLASQSELAAVLANISLLWIRAEYSARPTEQAELANVRLVASDGAAPPPTLRISRLANARINVAWPHTYALDSWQLWEAQRLNGPWQRVPNPDDIVSRDGLLHYETRPFTPLRFFQLRRIPCE